MLKAVFTLAPLLMGCAPVSQPDRLRFEAAVEVPMSEPADRRDLIAMLQRHAAAGGLHVDDNSDEARGSGGEPSVIAGRTIYIGVFRGSEDDDMEVSVDDGGHPGRAWVIFSRGAHPDLAARTRAALRDDIFRRWPSAQRLPVLPSGGLPLASDLRLTPNGYGIARSAARDYQLPATSPLLEPHD